MWVGSTGVKPVRRMGEATGEERDGQNNRRALQLTDESWSGIYTLAFEDGTAYRMS